MGALVVYESMFGATRDVAECVVAGLAGAGVAARAVEVGAADERLGDDVTLLVVGGPTHAFGMSRASSRDDARKQAPGGTVVSERVGVREWLDGLDLAGRSVPVAAFCTRVFRPRLPGSAAKAIGKELRRHGGRLVAPPQDFGVKGNEGPLEGQLDAARAWGATLAASSGTNPARLTAPRQADGPPQPTTPRNVRGSEG